MKLVVAIIKSFRLDDVRDAVTAFSTAALTVSEVQGFSGRQRLLTGSDGNEYAVNYTPKLKIEVAVDDDVVEGVVEAIQFAARTGKEGDGKIFVLDLGQAVRIRTGETDDEAL